MVLKCLENLRKTSETSQKCFSDDFQYASLKFSENLQKSSEVFGNPRKISENFGNGPKVIFRCFYDFLKIFGKSSEIVGSVRKSSENFRT